MRYLQGVIQLQRTFSRHPFSTVAAPVAACRPISHESFLIGQSARGLGCRPMAYMSLCPPTCPRAFLSLRSPRPLALRSLALRPPVLRSPRPPALRLTPSAPSGFTPSGLMISAPSDLTFYTLSALRSVLTPSVLTFSGLSSRPPPDSYKRETAGHVSSVTGTPTLLNTSLTVLAIVRHIGQSILMHSRASALMSEFIQIVCKSVVTWKFVTRLAEARWNPLVQFVD